MSSSQQVVFELALEEVLARFEPAYGESWPAAFEAMLTDVNERSRVDALRAELEARGRFTEPIHVGEAEVDLTGRETEPAYVANGMHRLCAHHLSGVGPVALTYDCVSDTEGWFDATWTGDEIDYDEMLARGSFRMDEHCWVGIDMLSTSDTELTAMFVGVRRECESSLASALALRFPKLGWPASLVWHSWDEDQNDL